MRRPVVVWFLVLAALLAWFSPALPALVRYGTLPKKADRPLNIILAGMDVEYKCVEAYSPDKPCPALPLDYNKSRTDTLMLAQIRPGGAVQLLSIPRDTWVNIDGYGWGKINSANRHGAEISDAPDAGPRLLVNTVQQLTGVQVDGYIFTSLKVVHDLTNAAGGVTVDVPSRMKYDDNAGHLHIDLQPGTQHLNGQQAEGFLRFRHDNMGDIGRVGRQQMFLSALAGKLKSPLNWWRLPAVAGALHRNTKSNLTRAQVSAVLGAALGGLKVNSQTVPGTFGGSGTWLANRGELAQIIEKDFRDPNDPRRKTIVVMNVAAPAGSARRLKEKLTALGYVNVTIQDVPRETLAVTTISGSGAQAVQQAIGHGQVTGDAPSSGADITVRLGSDTPEN